MEKSKIKLVLSAEAFGFGPTAAIATFFPYLREKFECIGYIGKGHTLDLQKKLEYNEIHDTSSTSDEEIKHILAKYDVLVTALDFEIAALAKEAGIKVVIYDPLTWYWKSIPGVVAKCDLYLAQNFFGVKDRLTNESHLFPKNNQIVAPIVSQVRHRNSKRYVLVNFGGLQNPFWSMEDVFKYASIFIDVIKRCIPKESELIISTSSAVATQFNDSGVKNYSRSEMYTVLENTKCAFMTSGLGNIYDAAKFDIPTAWLPPANDSQGQQLDLLNKNGMSDFQISWSDFSQSIDYWAAQSVVLDNIKKAVYSEHDFQLLEKVITKAYNEIDKMENSKTSRLITKFGTGGAEEIADQVVKYCQSIT